MDHRASFAKDVFGVPGTPTDAEMARMREAKSLIYEGLREVAGTNAFGRLGVLVDEDFGSAVTRAARDDDVVLAMPIEKSGSRVFELEYGDRFAEHVDAFDPDFFKVLVRYNPADDPGIRRDQLAQLKAVSDWADRVARRWLFELLIPPTAEQLAAHDGQDGYDRDARPSLTAEVLGELQLAGIHPTIWKLEGYDTEPGAASVLAAVAADAQHPAACIVLGRDAPLERVEHWLEIAAGQPGYVGFAVGRTIWERPLRDHLAQRISTDEMVEQIATTYRTLISTYSGAQHPPTQSP
jgi:myo-inositol catabolism protein IolC